MRRSRLVTLGLALLLIARIAGWAIPLVRNHAAGTSTTQPGYSQRVEAYALTLNLPLGWSVHDPVEEAPGLVHYLITAIDRVHNALIVADEARYPAERLLAHLCHCQELPLEDTTVAGVPGKTGLKGGNGVPERRFWLVPYEGKLYYLDFYPPSPRFIPAAVLSARQVLASLSLG